MTGATTFGIMTFSITTQSIITFSIMDLVVAIIKKILRIIILGMSIKTHYALCGYAECRISLSLC